MAHTQIYLQFPKDVAEGPPAHVSKPWDYIDADRTYLVSDHGTTLNHAKY